MKEVNLHFASILTKVERCIAAAAFVGLTEKTTILSSHPWLPNKTLFTNKVGNSRTSIPMLVTAWWKMGVKSKITPLTALVIIVVGIGSSLATFVTFTTAVNAAPDKTGEYEGRHLPPSLTCLIISPHPDTGMRLGLGMGPSLLK